VQAQELELFRSGLQGWQLVDAILLGTPIGKKRLNALMGVVAQLGWNSRFRLDIHGQDTAAHNGIEQ